jgi:hypothetical protein
MGSIILPVPIVILIALVGAQKLRSTFVSSATGGSTRGLKYLRE